MALQERRVIVIEAAERSETQKLRVAAYCRVSSDSSDQLNSFMAQTHYYTDLITQNPNWIMADIYADEGISGTSAGRRPRQRLLADCRAGKVDRILVKSISRFARNTLDCIQTVRELKQLGIAVEFEKEDIRELARTLGLPCADSPDSMEICFIPSGDYAAFIEARGMAGKSGRFIGPDGQDLGPHQGVLRYTLGQRKGLGIALGKPAFVKAIRENGDVVLGWAGEEFFSGMTLQNICTPTGEPLPAGEYLVKVRSAAEPVPCLFDGKATVRFAQPARAPAPGQSAVFYSGDVILGGGFIRESLF